MLEMHYLGGKVKKLWVSIPLYIFLESDNAITKTFRHHGGSDSIAASAISARIRELFKDNLDSTEAPIILLVYHEEETINCIRNMGVDVSAWCSGLRSLLFSDHSQVRLAFLPKAGSRNKCTDFFFRTWDGTVPLQGDIAMPRTLSTIDSHQIFTVVKIRGLYLPVEIR